MAAIAVRRGDWRPAIRPLGSGAGVAAIGDVHGEDALFRTLGDAVLEDLAAVAERRVVQVGDLLDRGPASVAALRRAHAGFSGAETVVLKGNHEAVFAAALSTDDPRAFSHWLQFGGAEVAAEVGVEAGRQGWRPALVEALGADLIDCVRTLPTMSRIGDLVFVHAGLDPHAPLDRQDDHTLIWTRRPWLDSRGPYAENVAVVHGHTPQPKVDLGHPHRVNLDTGAFKTGVLSALVVVEDRMRLVQAIR